MARHTERPARPATVLVASGSPPFEQSAAQLLVASGFVAACAFEWEAARLSVTRTQPRVVLIDGTSTIPHVCMVAEEAAARGIPLLLAHRENEFNDALSAFGARAQHMVGISLPLSADALRTSLTALLEPAGAGSVAQLPASPRRVTPDKDTPLLRRRDSLASTLHEIESGGLKGVGVIVVSRGWWDECHLSEQTAFRLRCDRQGIALRADDRLSRHFVELGSRPIAPPLSSEREV